MCTPSSWCVLASMMVFTKPSVSRTAIARPLAANGILPILTSIPFSALGKAMAIGETEGFVKVIADKKTRQVLGVHIVGPEASTMIGEAALSLEMAAFLEDISLTVHPHPTLSEAYMEAAANAMGAAIHIPNR